MNERSRRRIANTRGSMSKDLVWLRFARAVNGTCTYTAIMRMLPQHYVSTVPAKDFRHHERDLCVTLSDAMWVWTARTRLVAGQPRAKYAVQGHWTRSIVRGNLQR